MATKVLQNFLDRLSQNKNVQNVVNEFTKLSEELKKRGSDLNHLLVEGKEKTLHQAQSTYQEILKNISKSQVQLDKEVTKALELLRESAKEAEKNLEYYRKKVEARKAKIEKLLKSKKASGKAKSSPPGTRKKAKKAKKKTSRS